MKTFKNLMCVKITWFIILAFSALCGQGKVIGTVFTNWCYDFTDNPSISKKSAFDVSRAHLGYKHELNKNFTAEVLFDVERTYALTNVAVDPTSIKTTSKKDERYEAFLKFANLEWRNPLPYTTLRFGLIPMLQFFLQERKWGYRYIYNSFMDAYNYGPSCDLGITAKIKPLDKAQINFMFSHGEGLKKSQDADGLYKTALGLEMYPIPAITMYLYGDYMPSKYDGHDSTATITAAGFAGYEKKEAFKVGFEFNSQWNQKGIEAHDVKGISTYGTYFLSEKFAVFARVDMSVSKNDWNIEKDGIGIINGIEYSPIKNVRIAIDYQGFLWEDERSISRHKGFINVEVGF
ncbi:MAG: hypothetical protein AB1633_07515 [Elusimicrobiota bacterium]